MTILCVLGDILFFILEFETLEIKVSVSRVEGSVLFRGPCWGLPCAEARKCLAWSGDVDR
jgi:hypothetical protein